MTINHHNIDQWLFNYYEGNLSPSETKVLESFLKKNPEFYEDAQAWKNSFVEESVPAFDSSILVKEVNTADRKKFALAFAALLLLCSSSAFYFISKNNTSTAKKNTSTYNSFINPTTKIQSTTASTHAALVNETSSDKVTTTNETSTIASSEKVQEYTSNTISYSSSKNPVLKTSNNLAHSELNNTPGQAINRQTTNTLLTNNGSLSVSVNEKKTSLLDSNQESPIVNNGNLFNTSTLNGAEKTTEITATDLHNVEGTISPVVELTTIEVPEADLSHLSTVGEETINLSTEKADVEVVLYNRDGKSDLNPDILLATSENETKIKNAKDDGSPKHNLPTDKRIQFTNLKNVTLLSPVNFDFENNGSLIAQHYATDGYLAARYLSTTGTSNNTYTFTAGLSNYFKRAKVYLNAFGAYEDATVYKRTALNLQAAYRIKIDRFQYLIPSVTTTFSQYSFNIDPIIANTSEVNFFYNRLTGLNRYEKFQNSNQFNLNASLFYHSKRFYAGLSANGLAQPNLKFVSNDKVNLVKSPVAVQMVLGTDFISNKHKELSFSPQIGVELVDLEANGTVGGIFKYKYFKAGAAYSSQGGVNTYFGFTHKAMQLQYRFALEKTGSPHNNMLGHYVSANFNLKGSKKKQKAILDSEK